MPMPTPDRRTFVLSLGAFATATPLLARTVVPDSADGHHSVLMLNADCTNANEVNVFSPLVLHVNSGDTVQFLASDAGHNSASKRGMIPDGAEPWNGGLDEELIVKFTVPGIYGYICLPHYEWGMVGLVVVDRNLSNLSTVKKVRHPGDARKNFRALLNALESGDA